MARVLDAPLLLRESARMPDAPKSGGPGRGLRGALVAAVVAAAWLAGGATAQAQEEAIVGVCDFPITHEFTKVHGGTARDFEGTSAPFEFLVTGQYFLRVTNLDSGRSVELNSNAAGFYMKDGTQVFRGQVVSLFTSDRGDIPKGVWVSSGSMRAVVDGEGRIVTVTGGVQRRDICAELA
jgi:hypothetical protein